MGERPVTSVKARSDSRTAEDLVRAEVRMEMAAESSWCDIGPHLAMCAAGRGLGAGLGAEERDVCAAQLEVCSGHFQGIHELRKASAGGTRTRRVNLLRACNPCNQWVERQPLIAEALDLVYRSGHRLFDVCSSRFDARPAPHAFAAWPSGGQMCGCGHRRVHDLHPDEVP